MTTQNLKRKKINNHLADRKRTRASKNSAIIKSLSDKQTSKRAEEALRQESSFRNAIIEHATEGLCVCHEIVEFPHVAFTVWNDRMIEITGYTMNEINRLGWYQTMYPDPEVQARAIERMARMRQGDDIVGDEWEITRADGEKRLLSISTSVLQTGDGIAHVLALMQDITEHKQAEETLRQSEGKYRTILENITDGYFEVDIAGNFTFFNDSLCQLLGYSKDELMGMNHRQYTDQENSKKLYQTFNRVFRTGEPAKEFDWAVIRKDGAKRFGEVSISLMKDEKGQPIGFRGIARDVTERKQAEESLRLNEERYRTLVEESFDGIFIQKGPKIIFANQRLHEMLGYDKGELEGLDHCDVYHPDYQELTRERAEARMRGENVTPQYEVKLQRKDGSSFDGEINARKIMFGNGPGIQVWVRDITERKQAEEKLKESEEKYRLLVEESIQGIVIAQGIPPRMVFVNPAMTMILGYTSEELSSLSPKEIEGLVHSEDRAFFFKNYKDRLEGKLVLPRYEIRGIRKDGTVVWLELSSTYIEYKGQPAVQATFLDITERKQVEEALRTEKQRLQALTENSPFGMVMIDQNGNFRYMNPKFRELFGYDLSDVPDGRTWFRKAYPDSTYRHHVIETWIKDLKSLKPGEKRSEVFTVTCKDGTETTINFIPVQLETGENLMVCEDITERKCAEEALRESEERYRTILENIEDGYYEVDLPGNFTFFNDSLCRILGYSKEEMIGMGNQQYTDQENRKKLFQAFKEVYKTGEPTKGFDWKVFRKDGKELFGEVSVSLVKDSKGQPIGFRGIARDITERKQAEEVLRKSEEEFRLTFENAKDAIVWADPEAGVITKCNKEAETLFGKKRGEIIGSRQTTLHPPQKAEYYTNMFKKHMEHNGVADDEAEVITKSGKIKPVNITASLTLVGGKPIIQGIFRDITERKQAEEALRNEKQRFQTLSDQAPFGMVMVDRNGTFKYINPKFRELFGYDLTDIPDGKTWSRKAYPNPTYRHNVISAWIDDLKNIKQGEKRSRTFTVTCKDGTEKTINFIPVQLETGENLVACDDITKRIQTEGALRESEGRYRTLFEGSKDAVYITNREGKFISVNPAFLELFGYTKEELNLLSAQDTYVNPLDRNRFRQEIEQKGFVRDYEVKLRNKDGTEIDCLLTSSMRRDNDRSILGYQGIIRDITARKRSEQEMAALQEQFRQSQKMEAVGRLGGGIAHDFNNLLTIIKGYSQLSLLDLKENGPLWGNIQEIQKATQRATDLTRQLLAFSRRQILDLKVLDLNTLLKDLDKMLRRIIGEDIELTTLLAENLGRVKIDPGQFEQIILNLAVNARDAIPSGGKLTIETANVVLDEEYARTHVSVTPGPYVRLSVSDTGVGIPLEVKEKVFEPFFTTKEKGKGTGLGLSTVYGIVKQSGGNIWVYSEPAHGTTFKIYLPRVEEDLDTLPGRDETDFLPRGSETVLLVEDEPSVRDLAHRLLNQQGYKVLEAANGEEALRVVQEHIGEKIHLLLTDVVMPQMGGKELANQLKLLRPDVKVLYTSGYTDDAIVHHGVLEPGTHFLQKPFSPKTLSHKVREVLDR
jgi:PAS domain S-box-containing protein